MGGAECSHGCERCGHAGEVTFTGWQFLCKLCRAELVHEKVVDERKARLASVLDLIETGRMPVSTP